MEVVVGYVTSIFEMVGAAYDFIVGKPLLLAMIAIPVVSMIASVIVGFFRK